MNWIVLKFGIVKTSIFQVDRHFIVLGLLGKGKGNETIRFIWLSGRD